MKLTDNFTLSEAIKSDTALRLGIDNTAPEAVIERMKHVCTVGLEPARAHFTEVLGRPAITKINSFYRCEALEKAICWGGDDEKSSFAKWCKRRSLPVTEESWDEYFKRKSHKDGCAVDFEIAGVSNYDLARWVRDFTVTYDQIILEFHEREDPSSGWCHYSVKALGGNRRELLTINSKGTQIGLH